MAIKNFKGPSVSEEKIRERRILVSDYMTKQLITFRPDQPVSEVMDALLRNGISGGPVVDEKNNLLGIISEGHCMKEVSESHYFNMPVPDRKAKDFMNEDVETISCDLSIFDAAELFHRSRKRRFPVLKDNKLVGQISRRDVLMAFFKLKSNSW